MKFRDIRQAAATCLRFAVMSVLLLTDSFQRAEASDQRLLLDVQINGQPVGKIGEFALRDGMLYARRNELRDLGLRVPLALLRRDSSSSSSSELIPLSQLSGLSWRLDQKTQTLYVTAENSHLLPTVVEVGEREHTLGRRTVESGTGLTVNYDLVDTVSGTQDSASGSLDLRAFSPWGVASSGFLAYAGPSQGSNAPKPLIRLDSTFSIADPDSLRRYSLGDFITGGLSWTRPIRLAGAQVRSDFSMRPDLVTFPLPTLNGSVAVPSTVDVLANGNLVVSRQIGAGPFEIPQLPVVSGAGTISMTVTNAMGQQVNMSQPFYASSALLSPGLQTFSVQAGLVRHNWGVISNDYGSFAGTAAYRRGLTSKVTLETSMEATAGQVMAGAGGLLQIGHLGVLNAALAGSAGAKGSGTLLTLGAQRIGRVFSFGASSITAYRNFRDVAASNGDPVPRQQINASVGLSPRKFGSASVAFGSIDRNTILNPALGYLVSAEHSRILSANYSIQVHGISIYLNTFRSLTTKTGNGFQIGLVIPFHRRSSAGIAISSDGSVQVQAQKSAAEIGQWGYQAYLSSGDTAHEFAQGQYKSRWGLLTAGVDSDTGKTSLRLETQGALSLVDWGFFPSNTIYDSFGIVDTSPLDHIRVLQENRDVGSTNSSGRLLVPDLRSFDLNNIAIDSTAIPADITVDITARQVRPQDRSGVVVKFPVRVSHGALLKLVDEKGSPVPVGSTARLQATNVDVPVGYEGEAYVEGLDLKNQIIVNLGNGRHCTVVFDYRVIPGEIPVIGPLSCREIKQSSQ